MKKILFWGACTLLTTMLFSCSADEDDTTIKKEVKKDFANEKIRYSILPIEFDEYYNIFREKRNAHFKHLQTNLKSNLEIRLAIVEELKELINPQENIKCIHVAGTNGKGSTSHMLASILQEAGYRVGLYTSPHLYSFTERIKINGIQVAEEWVADFVTNHQNLIEKVRPSFFEWTVIMAFTYFKEQQVDYAIIETGLGGRLDSTNIISPLACLITNISFDHQDLLGDTLEKIASEKAGIIKSHIPVTISEKQPETSDVFLAKATSVNAPLQFASDIISAVDFTFTSPTWGEMKVNSPYKGYYQQKNIRGVLAWCEQIQSIIPLEAVKIKSGIERTRLNTGLQGICEILLCP